ncbi:MAG: hypothetical protein MJE12_06115, partial [Alphaproteobacteria bacterium]|nr:hypothetical protein [Alphaproteobacteria bacterium]
AKKMALLTLHGMGDKKKTYHKELVDDLSNRVGADAWSEIHFSSIFYSDVFQGAQEKLFRRVESKVDSKRLRRFLLYGFADAGGLEHSRTIPNSAYKAVQKRIFDAMGVAYAALDKRAAPVVLIAQSLGCQVISNYIWDAQHHARRPPGIWRQDHGNLDPGDLRFRKFSSLRVLVTTGCNIPIFVGGLPREQIKPIRKPNQRFVWENYFDEDDPLGWPLRELNDAYKALVTDIEVNAGGLFTSWTPFSHSQYWGDGDVQEPLADHLLSLLGRN